MANDNIELVCRKLEITYSKDLYIRSLTDNRDTFHLKTIYISTEAIKMTNLLPPAIHSFPPLHQQTGKEHWPSLPQTSVYNHSIQDHYKETKDVSYIPRINMYINSYFFLFFFSFNIKGKFFYG